MSVIFQNTVMKKLALLINCVILAIIVNCQDSEESKIFYEKAIRQINQKHVQWIKSKAADANASPEGISSLQTAAQGYLRASNLGTVDPNALVQLVLREAYVQSTEDLKYYAEKVKYFNTQKKMVRDYLQKLRDHDANARSVARSQYDSIKRFSSSIQTELNPPSNTNINRTVVKVTPQKLQAVNRPMDQNLALRPVSVEEVKLLIRELEQKEDSLNELGDELSLRMQMVMERMQKADSMASNMFKKFSEVSSSIIANLK